MYGKYTVVLKSLIDSPEVKPLLDKALSKYPLFTPVDDEFVKELIPSREQLNQKLLNHYKYREIGFETVGRFLDELEIVMSEIMPYYNQLYKSVQIMSLIEDPFGNVDVTETFEQESTDNSSSSSSAESSTNASDNSSINSKTKAMNSTMPQGNIAVEDVDNLSHADSGSWGKDSSTSSGSSQGSTESSSEGTSESRGTVKHTFTKKGNQGVNTYAHDMKELRETFLNVTNQIIDDIRIRELFLNVF
jgi:hypothetical protein